jgi:hypothetical protein
MSSMLGSWTLSPHMSAAEANTFVTEIFEMKTERFEGHHEATKALALSVVGVMVAVVMWNFMLLLYY